MAINQDAVDHTGLLDGYPQPTSYEPTEEDKKIVARLKEWRDKAEQFRQPWERQAELNRLYLKGDQLLARNKISGEIVRLSSEDSRRLKSQNNGLRPIARSLVGKLARMTPTYVVDPATADFEEQHGARTATSLLQYVRSKEDLDLIYSKLCNYLPWAGNAFAQIVWDKMAGRKVYFCSVCSFFVPKEDMNGAPCPQCTNQREMDVQAEQQRQQQMQEDMQMAAAMGVPPIEPPPQLPPQGALQPDQEIPLLQEAYEGDVRVIVRDPRDVFVPPGCSDIRSARTICVRELVEVAEAKRRYPMFAAFLNKDQDLDRTRRQFQVSGGYTASAVDLDDHCHIWEYHELPTEAYPNGRLLVVINDFLVEERESPYYKLNRVPVFHFGFDPIDGEFYCDPFITQAWHRQKELNLLESQLREHVDLVLRPKLMNPLGSRISAEEFHADSAQVINYSAAAGQPNWVPPPQLPPDVWNRKNDLMQDMRLAAGVTESEQGVSQADPNGRALAIINAESDQQVGPIMSRNNSEWRELHRAIIVLLQCYAHPDRIASISGPDGTQVLSFEALYLLQPGWDIRMEQEEGLSRNPAIRLQQAMELNAAGFFVDAATGAMDKKAFARYAKLRVPEAGFDQEATERACASQIPYLIKQGKQWEPHTFDIPQIFMEELGAWLRGPGRREDFAITQQVEQIWQYYTQWAMTGQMGMGPGQGQPGQDGQAPGGQSQPGQARTGAGGTPGNTGGVGTEAAGVVKDADAQGEQMATQAAQQ